MLDNLLSHLLTMGKKSITLGLVSLRGSPKYVNGRLPTIQPKDWAKASAVDSSMLIGISIDLVKFTLSPVKEKE